VEAQKSLAEVVLGTELLKVRADFLDAHIHTEEGIERRPPDCARSTPHAASHSSVVAKHLRRSPRELSGEPNGAALRSRLNRRQEIGFRGTSIDGIGEEGPHCISDPARLQVLDLRSPGHPVDLSVL
jgi:hypothetical protein